MSGWTESSVPPQHGKTFVVTGANSGLGRETARVLTERGAYVILAVRRPPAGERAASDFAAANAVGTATVMELDLASLRSVVDFANVAGQRLTQLSGLVNVAGIMAVAEGVTDDGFERHFGTNHLGHFALTAGLLPILLATPGARVVTVSSDIHRKGRIDYANINGEVRYRRWTAYAHSKLGNVLFAYELGRRAAVAGRDPTSVACHSGLSSTGLQTRAAREKGRRGSGWTLLFGLGQSPARASVSILRAATDPDARSDEYFGPKRTLRGPAVRTRSSALSYDETLASSLWELSERLTGVSYVF